MLSMLPVSLFPDIISGQVPVSVWSETAAEIGLDAFDISILFVKDRTPAGITNLRNELSTGGLPLAMVATYPDFTNPDPTYVEKELFRALSDISIAADLGAQFVRMTAGQYYPCFDVQAQLDSACRAMEICAKYAEQWNIQLLWENHSKPGAWIHPDFNFEKDRLMKMFHRFHGSSIRMNYDIANAYLLGLGNDFLAQCFSDIVSIHINDVASITPLRFSGIGDGLAPVAQTLKQLHQWDYDGLYSIEEASMCGFDGIHRYCSATKQLLCLAAIHNECAP